VDGSPKIIAASLKTYFIEFCREIHDYSFDIFAYRVNRHKVKLSKIRGYIEQHRMQFMPEQHSTLMRFLRRSLGLYYTLHIAENPSHNLLLGHFPAPRRPP
jgi:hypothetical protein